MIIQRALYPLLLIVTIAAAIFFFLPQTGQQTLHASLPILNDSRYVAKVFFEQDAELMEIAGQYAFWEVNREARYFVVDLSAREIEALTARGFRVEIDEGATKGIRRVENGRSADQVEGIPGFACYKTVEEGYALGAQLSADYPTLAQWLDAGDSWEKVAPGGNPGYEMMVLRLSNQATSISPNDKPKLAITTGIHARELTPPELAIRFAQWLLTNYGVDPEATWLLDHRDIHLMFFANPDGRKKAETGLLWRKNTNEAYCGATSNSRGVDLNRNFPVGWNSCGGSGCSSGSACAETYRGPSPASEPETQTVVNYLRAIFPDQRGPALTDAVPLTATGLYLDLHSYGRLVLWSWGDIASHAPNSLQLQTLGRKFATYNNYTPYQAYNFYPTDGTTDDFGYGELGLASFTFELGTAFFEACSSFENTILPANLPALIYAAKVADAPYLTPSGPNATTLAVSSALVFAGEGVTLSAEIDDTQFNNSQGVEPTQAILQAEYYLDRLPHEGGTPLPLSATDGTFNGKIEQVQAVLDTTSWSIGRHTLFVRGRDTDGNWGAFSAIFLDIADPTTIATLSGYVREQGSNDPISGATVEAGGQTTTTLANGFYSLPLPPATYTVTATAEGYSSIQKQITLAPAQQVTQSFLLPLLCTIFADDVENGPNGWTAADPWAISTENAASPTHAWTDSVGGDYQNNIDLSLVSPAFDLTTYQSAELQFQQLCNTETDYDFCHVELSVDNGTTWSEVAVYTGEQTAWSAVKLPLSSLVGVSQARIRFRLETDSSQTADGWQIDDIRLIGESPLCLPAIPVAVKLAQETTDRPNQLPLPALFFFLFLLATTLWVRSSLTHFTPPPLSNSVLSKTKNRV